MVHILEEAQRGTLTMDAAVRAAQAAIAFLGKTFLNLSKDRCSKALIELNKDLVRLTEIKAVFDGATCWRHAS